MAIVTVAFFAMVAISCVHEPQVATRQVSFRGDIIPIMRSSCALNGSCHLGANNTNGQINLDSSVAYSCIVSRHLVMTSNPASSLLYYEVASGAMPKAPNGRLPEQQINLILNWIRQGAQDN